MDRHDKRRFVQQYVERQKAYLPTYTTEHLCHGTPSKPLRSDEFGFDTPVLRPRVPANETSQSHPTPKAGPSKSRTREAESGPPPAPAPSRPKRKKASTPTETDSERAARLADRRERKRKKRAIVNPPRKHDDETTPTAAPKKGRTKKPTALALLYGFSATNVTKDRLTLKPALSLGVFSKGRASAKKKVTATNKAGKHPIVLVENAALKDSASRQEIFSESAFLNKPSGRVDHSEIDHGLDGSSISSISSDPAPQATRTAKKDRAKLTETRAPQASTRPTAESEVWDIELQSKLPSSARDVSSEPEANDSAPVVLDLRGAKWSASLNMAVEHEGHCNKTRTRSLSITQHSPLARSDLRDELGITHIKDTPSIHPSHSASQVGRCVADIQPSDLRQVTSRYFTELKPVSVQESAAHSPQISRANDGLDILDWRIPGQDVQDDTLHAHLVASPISSLISVAQPMVGFQTRYDVAPLAFSSDCSPYDDCYARADVPLERDGGYLESCVVEQSIGVPEYYDPQRGALYSMAGLAGGDVGHVSIAGFQGTYDPSALEHEDDLEVPVLNTYDPGEGDSWFCMDSAVCEDDSICWDAESGEGVPLFLEGRALLLGVPEWPQNVGLSGVAQAEMDVASRLRDHWRPLRLS